MSDTATPRPHRLRRIALWVAGIVLLLPVALVLLVLLAANVGPGRAFIESEVGSLTGGTVVLRGLSGRFPDALRLAHAELRDARGAWLTLDGVALDWSPTALLGRVARIDRLTAEHVGVPRLPVPAQPAKPAPPAQGSGGFSLPVRVDVRSLAVARLDLGAPVAGAAAAARIAGSGTFKALDDAGAKLAIDRLDGAGTYRLDGRVDARTIKAVLDVGEPAGGLVSGLAKLPALGALSIHGGIDGPRNAERTELTAQAGALHAQAHGTVDLVGGAAALDIDAAAPAMAPRPDIAWGGISLQAHVQGPFTAPDVAAHARLTDVKGGGAAIASLVADVSGNRGTVDAHTVLTGLVLPPPKPDLFAASPLDFTVHVALDKPELPIRFALRHTLLTADGTARAGGDIAATIHTVVPDLAPLAAIGGVDIRGRTEATASMAVHGQRTDVTVDGTADFTGGQAPVPTLLGPTTYGVTASLAGQDITITRAVVDGRAAHAGVTGTDIGGRLALAWRLALTDLAAASPRLLGALQATGRVDGPQAGIAVQADIKGEVGTEAVPRGPVSVAIRAQGLPADPQGTIEAQGRLAGAAIALSAQVQKQPDGGLHAVLKRAAWKSLDATADMVLAKGARLPLGNLSARMTRLADLSPLIGQPLAGSLVAKLATTAAHASIDVQVSGVAAAHAALGHLSLTGQVRDPAGTPDLALVLDASGLDASGVTGGAHATLTGPQTALLLRANTALVVSNAPAGLSATARLDLPAKQVTLQALSADYKGEALRLRAPSRIDFGAVTAIDQLRLALGAATLDVAGRIAPTLSLTAALRHVTPDLARPFAPTLQAAGLLTADVRLTGTTAAPQGSVRVQASGVRLRSGPAASLPAASLLANVELRGTTARLDARLDAGPKLHLAANGTAPLAAGAALAVRATGQVDLRLLDPVLNASGQRAAGNLALDATVGGTTAAPRIDGAVTLDHGEVQDFVQGVRLTDVTARLAASGDTVRIESLSAHAGAGTLSASGSVGVLAAGVPVDLRLRADHARPLASDLLTATLDMDLRVHGEAAGEMLASGRIFLRQADINIPNGLPPSVAVLRVRRPGDRPPPPPSAAPPAVVRLAIEVDAPNGLFVRGHGLDSELGGTLKVGGTSAAPQIDGGFQMRRGTISVAGTTLTFSKGEVGFDGSGVTNKIDPTLDFVADSNSGSVTATLTVGGYADAPKITLSSVPDLPQDEVLAHLLFGTSVKDLSAIQIAEIASALAELSGVTGGGGDPLGAVRKGLGLDRLSVGGASGSGTGATVEAGRYVARGVYVGAKQATSGGGTAAEVQIDLTRRLKAKAQLATGGGSVQGATPDNDPGSTVGLSYQFEY